MRDILLWFDDNPTAYWSVAITLHLAVLSMVAWPLLFSRLGSRAADAPNARHWFTPPVLFCLTIALAIAWHRYPWVFVNRELNADESDWLVQAMVYQFDPMPWRATHGGTSGPLTAYALTLLSCFGAPLNYSTAHGLAAALAILITCGTFVCIASLTTVATARLAILPLYWFFAAVNDPSFVHLTSEHLPLALLSIGSAVFGIWFRQSPRNPLLLVTVGVYLALMAFAKLQAVPLGIATASCFIGLIFCEGDSVLRYRNIASLVGGALLVPTAFFTIMLAGSTIDDFFSLYLADNSQYSNRGPLGLSTWQILWHYLWVNRSLTFFLCQWLTLCIGTFTFVIYAGLRLSVRQCLTLAGICSMLAASVFAVLKPGFPFAHYTLLLLVPITWMNAFCLMLLRSIAHNRHPGSKHRTDARRIAKAFPLLATCLLLAAPAAHVVSQAMNNPRPHGEARKIAGLPPHATARFLIREADPEDSLAVWGWRQDIYVESGLKPTLRDAETSSCILDKGNLKPSRERLLADVSQHQPEWFVDAVAPKGIAAVEGFRKVWGDQLALRRLGGHEVFPQLQALIQRDYQKVFEIPIIDPRGMNRREATEGIRIYRRKCKSCSVAK